MHHIFDLSDGEFDISFRNNGIKGGFKPVFKLKNEVQFSFSDRVSGSISAILGRHINRENLLITRLGSSITNQPIPDLTIQSQIITRTLLVGTKYHFQTSTGIKPFIGILSGWYWQKEKDFSATFSGRQNPLSIDHQTDNSPVSGITCGFYFKIFQRVSLNCATGYMFPLSTSATDNISGLSVFTGLKIDI
jgi:outer membrane protein W